LIDNLANLKYLSSRSRVLGRDFGVMGIEEQKEEREVLDSIFPEEITGMRF
jgi:hypothetical protein